VAFQHGRLWRERAIQGQDAGRVFLNLVPTSRFLRDKATFPDVFDPGFQRDLQTSIERQCRDVRENPRLLGYMWTDTPRWNLKDARRAIKNDWVSTLRQLAATAPGKIA
jgi:hypothetical protein